MIKIGGCLSATARVQKCGILTADDSKAALIDCYNITRFGLRLTDIKNFEMIPMKGKQGIWYEDINYSQLISKPKIE